ncbi:MAG TPA: PAS domain-containing protein [Phototrophicaceae bacterium]|jgi:PAS domain S-box-containing protein|nr:PAS domain-containing protein [Phototrophicaceae bacterium]
MMIDNDLDKIVPVTPAGSQIEENFKRRIASDLDFHNNAHDGIVFTDKDNRVVYANPYFLTMMGIEKVEDILNQPLPTYMWTATTDADTLFHDVRTYGYVREREMNLHNRKQEPVFAVCSSVASVDETGNFIGTEIMLCNITGKRKLQAELIERNRMMERITELTRSTMEMMKDMVQRRADIEEFGFLVDRLETELKRIQ